MAQLDLQPLVLAGEGWEDYALLDSGNGLKFERYGAYSFIRPEAQALWQPWLEEWDADGEFVSASDEDGGEDIACLTAYSQAESAVSDWT